MQKKETVFSSGRLSTRTNEYLVRGRFLSTNTQLANCYGQRYGDTQRRYHKISMLHRQKFLVQIKQSGLLVR
ncbi:hypothetical protein R1flu_001309 [Riccia fluitans]|uniref:Uncharacterized protein n=1 Tax=Riccia fluitans TaxID=41844 RepID=A0ABD1Y2W8_9MARC